MAKNACASAVEPSGSWATNTARSVSQAVQTCSRVASRAGPSTHSQQRRRRSGCASFGRGCAVASARASPGRSRSRGRSARARGPPACVKNTVALTMTHTEFGSEAGGRRRRRPNEAIQLVAQVDDLTGRIAYRVIAPRRQALALATAQVKPKPFSETTVPKCSLESTLHQGAGGRAPGQAASRTHGHQTEAADAVEVPQVR